MTMDNVKTAVMLRGCTCGCYRTYVFYGRAGYITYQFGYIMYTCELYVVDADGCGCGCGLGVGGTVVGGDVGRWVTEKSWGRKNPINTVCQANVYKSGTETETGMVGGAEGWGMRA